MGKITDALKKAAEERLKHIEKLEEQGSAKYQFVAQKTMESNIDPRIVTFYDSKAPVAEQYRTLRTNLQSIKTEKPIKAIVITSSNHSEGKTITSINLALSMAHDLNNKSILLVDADMRRGSVHKYLGIKPEAGLADILSDSANIDNCLLNIGVNNLTILPAGKIPHNPAELLGSQKMKNLLSALRSKYDYVILDTPPIIPVTDAGLLSSQSDGAILVVQAGRTQKGVVMHSESILRQAQAKILGCILTNVQYHIPGYLYRYL